jgi:hypothetical protein
MPSVNKYLKEFENLVPKEELSKEEKLKFLETQIEGFQTQAYRFQIDVDVAKRYIAVGKQIGGEEAYTSTGEAKIQEAVQSMRSIVINLEKLCQLRDELKSQ